MNATRATAVAGTFYPDAPGALARAVDGFLDAAPSGDAPAPKALIAPHAGYIYSGAIAARAYAALAPARDTIRRVVLLGPVHRVPVRGLAAPGLGVTAFATPLGEIPLDREAIDKLRMLPQVVASDAAHAMEHSLEVHLPFLQKVLARFSLVPLAVGDASAEEVAEALEMLWGGAETVIVVSSDLSHYLDYATARRTDQQTAARIVALDPRITHEEACGGTPINGLLLSARHHGLSAELLDLRNSGDTAGPRDRVVGYGAFAFREASVHRAGAPAGGELLLRIARAAIAKRLGIAASADDSASWLEEPGATFVTLNLEGALRGCIGSLQPHRALRDDVRENAIAAAFRDPRFAPVARDEFDALSIEVSLLSPAEPVACRDEADAICKLVPGADGVILELGARRATFLPQVWESLPDPRRFLAELKLKAGLAADYWSTEMRVSRYGVEKWSESGTRPAGRSR